MDPVAELYLQMRLNEMAFASDADINALTSKEVRNAAYTHSKDWDTYKTLDSGARVVKKTEFNPTEGCDTTIYKTLDDKNGEVIHQCIVHRRKKEPNIDATDYEHVSNVSRVPNHPLLPAGYVTNEVYEHFLNSDLPLRSDKSQTPHGHHMWRKLVARALNDGHHVYYAYGPSLTKVDHSSMNDFLNTYRNKGRHAEHKHMILSKIPLV